MIRKSIIFASLISGVYFIIKAFTKPTVTGAVIGSNNTNQYALIAVTLFLLAMAITHFYET